MHVRTKLWGFDTDGNTLNPPEYRNRHHPKPRRQFVTKGLNDRCQCAHVDGDLGTVIGFQRIQGEEGGLFKGEDVDWDCCFPEYDSTRIHTVTSLHGDHEDHLNKEQLSLTDESGVT